MASDNVITQDVVFSKRTINRSPTLQTSFAISVHQLSMSDVTALYTACGEAETRNLVEYEAELIFHPLM